MGECVGSVGLRGVFSDCGDTWSDVGRLFVDKQVTTWEFTGRWMGEWGR